jgi:hypothetical protein
VARGKTSLLSQIQSDAVDEGVSISTALRKCLILGGESGSSQLREWARRELEGYGPDDELPAYRSIRAPLMVDGVSGFYQVTHQQIPASSIPDFARERVSENLELRYAVRNLEAMLDQAEIRLQPPAASDLARYMNMTAGTQIVSLYWSVSQTEIHGVLDQIRTALIQLVVELRSHMEDDDAIPTAETANQAVNVVINGERSSVQITTAQASGAKSSATATATMNDPELVPLLANLESALRTQGDGEAAEKVAHLATLVETPARDETKIRRLWDAIKLAATTNEAVSLVGRITPLLLASSAHHH